MVYSCHFVMPLLCGKRFPALPYWLPLLLLLIGHLYLRCKHDRNANKGEGNYMYIQVVGLPCKIICNLDSSTIKPLFCGRKYTVLPCFRQGLLYSRGRLEKMDLGGGWLGPIHNTGIKRRSGVCMALFHLVVYIQ